MIKRINHKYSSGKSAIIVEYYAATFKKLHQRLSDEIRDELLVKPHQVVVDYWSSVPHNNVLDQGDAWERLHTLLLQLETMMAALLKDHSAYYWVHLYRRLGVLLGPHRNKTDTITTLLVRTILETALLKHSSLAINDDIEFSNRVQYKDVLGGLYAKMAQDIPAKKRAKLGLEWTGFIEQPQWVLKSFSESDFLTLYALEGLSYEYWFATAKLRAVGKGDKRFVAPDGDLDYVRSPDFDRLLSSYDERIENFGFEASIAGVGFYGDPQNGSMVPVAIYNASRNAIQKPFSQKLNTIDGGPLNFELGAVDLKSYLSSHDYLSPVFKDAHGYSLSSFVRYLALVHRWYFIRALDDIKMAHQLLQRAYIVESGPIEKIRDGLLMFSEELGEKIDLGQHENLEKEISAIEDRLTLNSHKQSMMNLWSMGPRYLYIPYREHLIVDYTALPQILYTAHYGLRSSEEDIKGGVFEDSFRSNLVARGFPPFPIREFRNLKGEKKEADAVIHIKDTLYIFECRAMRRPLDFEIGRIPTIETRIEEFEKKLNQAEEVRTFFSKSPLGNNYDFSSVKNIEHFVVSPYVEWVWSTDTKFWYNEKIPRILSGSEALNLLERISPKVE